MSIWWVTDDFECVNAVVIFFWVTCVHMDTCVHLPNGGRHTEITGTLHRSGWLLAEAAVRAAGAKGGTGRFKQLQSIRRSTHATWRNNLAANVDTIWAKDTKIVKLALTTTHSIRLGGVARLSSVDQLPNLMKKKILICEKNRNIVC